MYNRNIVVRLRNHFWSGKSKTSIC